MSIEEAENILNEAVITEPSISSYTYISADEINKAIQKMLEENLKNQNIIKELEYKIIEEKNKLEKIILDKEIRSSNYPVQTHQNRRVSIKKIIKCFKKVMPALWEVRC